MKKCVILCITLLLLFTACAAQPEGSEYPYAERDGMMDSELRESPDGYYLWQGDYLYFTDRETMDTLVVCTRFDCLHDAELRSDKKEDCMGFFSNPRGTGEYFFFGNGKLYLFTRSVNLNDSHRHVYSLLEAAPDGTERRTLYDFPDDIQVVGAILHRGVFYIASQVFDEAGQPHFSLYSLPLNGKKLELLQDFKDAGVQSMSLTAHGDYLYYTSSVMTGGEFRVGLYRLDLRTKKTAEIPPESPDRPWLLPAFHGDRLLLTGEGYDPAAGKSVVCLYSSALDGTDRRLVLEGDNLNLWTDGEYLYAWTMTLSGEEHNILSILDMEGRELDRVVLDTIPDTLRDTQLWVVVPTAGDRVLLVMQDYGGRMHYCWFAKSDIGSGSIRPALYFQK